MSSNATLSVQVPGLDVMGLARETIAAKLTESMLGDAAITQSIIVSALQRKVNSSGNVSTSSYDNTIPFIEYMAQDFVRSVVRDVLKQQMDKLRPVLEKRIETELRRHISPMAKMLVESYARTAGDQWCTSVDIKVAPRERS